MGYIGAQTSALMIRLNAFGLGSANSILLLIFLKDLGNMRLEYLVFGFLCLEAMLQKQLCFYAAVTAPSSHPSLAVPLGIQSCDH